MYIKTKLKTFLHVFLIAGIITSCGNKKSEETEEAAEEETETGASDATLNDDADFFVDVTMINYKEIELGKLAQVKGTTQDVKDLGKLLEDDHTKYLEEVKNLAEKKGINIPTKAPKEVEDARMALDEKTGAAFDKEYCQMMVEVHEEAIEMLEAASEDTKDPEVKDWVNKTLPKLRAHLEDSRTCQMKCNETASDK